jgi:hypothetical protein
MAATGYRGGDPFNLCLENCMVLRTWTLLLLVLVAGAVTGCYLKPVRHLAADVALLKIGRTTAEEVLVYLGDPDARQPLAGGGEQWLYTEKRRTLLEKTPMVGKYIGDPEELTVVVTLTNGVVTDCSYSSHDEDDYRWGRDFSWQQDRQ